MKKRNFIITLIVVAAIAVRLGLFDYETLDYKNFLTNWVTFFKNNGGFSALKYSVGNYNIPYLYFLAAFSYSSVRDLYLIKALSCAFDFLLAFSSAGIAAKCGASKKMQTVLFGIILFLPTVVINSALWAQCDSIYVSLALFAIYLALSDKPSLSMVFFALSFGFKLQAVFILPVSIILLIMKKYRWYHFFVFPLTYFILILPAVIIGRPIGDAITLYLDQMDTVGTAANYNSPALNALTGGDGSVYAAFAAMVVVLIIAFLIRKSLDNTSFLLLSVILVTIIPFLLPHMHDRYFYASDVLSVIVIFTLFGYGIVTSISASFAAVFQQFASLICYLAYLKTYYIPLGHIYLTNDRGAVAVLISLIIFALTVMYIQFDKIDKLH